jgi:hypothetical protein
MKLAKDLVSLLNVVAAVFCIVIGKQDAAATSMLIAIWVKL